MNSAKILKLGLPTGRMADELLALLRECGLQIEKNSRAYRPVLQDPTVTVKFFKPQIIPRLVELEKLDAGFTGHDLVVESGCAVREITDTTLNPVRIVAAAPAGFDLTSARDKNLVVASEYNRLARQWLDARHLRYTLLRSYGATEVFPPEDADMIIDNTASGQTLRANRLEILDTLLTSSTRLIVNARTQTDPTLAGRLANLDLLMRATLAGRQRVILEMNVAEHRLVELVAILPAMKSPTVQKLYGNDGYAVKVAVLEQDVSAILPRARAAGATDIIEYNLKKVVM